MRKIFSEFALTMLAAICSIYAINIFMDCVYKSSDGILAILKLWLSRLM